MSFKCVYKPANIYKAKFNVTPRPLYPWERNAVPVVWEAVWIAGAVRTVAEKSPPPEFDPRTVQHVANLYTD